MTFFTGCNTTVLTGWVQSFLINKPLKWQDFQKPKHYESL